MAKNNEVVDLWWQYYIFLQHEIILVGEFQENVQIQPLFEDELVIKNQKSEMKYAILLSQYTLLNEIKGVWQLTTI